VFWIVSPRFWFDADLLNDAPALDCLGLVYFRVGEFDFRPRLVVETARLVGGILGQCDRTDELATIAQQRVGDPLRPRDATVQARWLAVVCGVAVLVGRRLGFALPVSASTDPSVRAITVRIGRVVVVVRPRSHGSYEERSDQILERSLRPPDSAVAGRHRCCRWCVVRDGTRCDEGSASASGRVLNATKTEQVGLTLPRVPESHQPGSRSAQDTNRDSTGYH
jgi:hypothetical protein